MPRSPASSWLALAPSLALVGVCVYGAALATLWLSLTAEGGLGLDGWRALFARPDWIAALWTLATFGAPFVVIALGLGLAAALALDRAARAGTWLRAALFAPLALSSVVAGVAWRWLLGAAGDGAAFGALVAASVWQGAALAALILLAALGRTDPGPLRAARLDGAGALTAFRRAVLPQIGGALAASAGLLALMAIRTFDLAVALAGQAAPAALPAVLMHRLAFGEGLAALGGAAAWTMVGLAAVIAWPLLARAPGARR